MLIEFNDWKITVKYLSIEAVKSNQSVSLKFNDEGQLSFRTDLIHPEIPNNLILKMNELWSKEFGNKFYFAFVNYGNGNAGRVYKTKEEAEKIYDAWSGKNKDDDIKFGIEELEF